jgi:large subunit ribosomal protein L21
MEVIIKQGKDQFRIKENDEILIDKLNLEPKSKIIIDRVLACINNDKIDLGVPYLENIKVHAEVLEDVKGDKVINFKYKPKKNYHRTVGHRQQYSKIKISKIELI